MVILGTRRLAGRHGSAAVSAPPLIGSATADPSEVVGGAAARGVRRVIPQLTGIRALAALWVACFHFRPYLIESFPWSWPLTPLFNVGHLGVDLFFILSGFILTFTHLDRMAVGLGPRKIVGFLWLRLSRVWPVTATMLLVYGVYRVAQTWVTGDPGYASSLDVQRLLAHLALVQAWGSAHHDWNPVDWSISAEWMAYLAFGFLVVFLVRARAALSSRALAVLAGVVLVPMVIIGASLDDGADLTWTGDQIVPGIVALRVLTEFVAGAFVALIVQRAGAPRRLPFLLRPAVIMTAIVVVIYLLQRFDPVWRPRFGQEWNYDGHSLWGSTESVIVVPLFAVLIGSLALTSGGISRVLSSRPLVWGGKVSFAFYLAHWFFLDLMLFILGQTTFATDVRSLSHRLLLLGTMSVAVVAGWVLYRFVEEPARRGMRRMLPRSIDI